MKFDNVSKYPYQNKTILLYFHQTKKLYLSKISTEIIFKLFFLKNNKFILNLERAETHF